MSKCDICQKISECVEECQVCREDVCTSCSFPGGSIEAASSAMVCHLCCEEHLDELSDAIDNIKAAAAIANETKARCQS